jgi:hypothetical protein
LVPRAEGPKKGSNLRIFYDTCHVDDWGKFAVVPVAELVGKISNVPSFGWCPFS